MALFVRSGEADLVSTAPRFFAVHVYLLRCGLAMLRSRVNKREGGRRFDERSFAPVAALFGGV